LYRWKISAFGIARRICLAATACARSSRARQARPVARGQWRQAQPDEHGHEPGGVARRDPDHPVADARKRDLPALRQPDRAELGGGGGGGGENEQRREKRQNEWAAQEFAH
jgi:hypothetical protein